MLYVSDPYPPTVEGGAEIYAHRLAFAMQRQGHDVRVLTTAKARGGSSYAHEGVPVMAMPASRWPAFDPSPPLPRDLGTFDVIHLHNFRRLTPGIVRALSGRARRIVWTVHDYYPVCHRINMIRRNGVVCRTPANPHCPTCFFGPSGALPRGELPARGYLEQVALRMAVFPYVQTYVCPSTAMQGALQHYGIPAGRTVTIPYGLDAFADAPLPAEPKLLYLGRIDVAHKGLDVLLDALALAPDGPPLDVVGFGDPSSAVERIRRLGLSARVQVHGATSDVKPWIARASAIIVPSIWEENLPLTVQEAMMAGRAVIAARVGGIPDMVDDGQTGILVPPGDSPALAAAIQRLLLAPEHVVTYGREARARALRMFDMREHVRALESLYN